MKILLGLLWVWVVVLQAEGLCVNRTALVDVDVSVYRNNVRTKLRNININQLEPYQQVDVLRANVTVLCEGMIRKLPLLTTLSLINVNLSEIEVNSFPDLPKLKSLSLSVNHLEKIQKGVFNKLKSLKVLYLSQNKITHLEEQCFEGLSELKSVHLDRNFLKKVPGNIFQACPRLSLINFSHNEIQKIETNSFADLRLSDLIRTIELRLTNNQIEEFEPEALNELPPVRLHLEQNRIKVLSSVFHTLKENSWLFLNGNQLECVPDDVLETMRNTTKFLQVTNNPISCGCLDRFQEVIGEEVYGRGEIYYNTTLPCGGWNSVSFK